jgi:hypothetical protein
VHSRAIGDLVMKVKDTSKGADVRAISCVPSFQTVHVTHGLDEKQKEELTALRDTMASYEPEVKSLLAKVSTARTASLVPSRKLSFDEKVSEGHWGHSSWRFPLAEADVALTVDSEYTSDAASDEKNEASSEGNAPATSTSSPSSPSSSSSSYFPFMVIGCDGLYDVMSNEEVCAFVNRKLHEIVSFGGKKANPTGKPLSWRSVNAISKQVCTTALCIFTCVKCEVCQSINVSISVFMHMYTYQHETNPVHSCAKLHSPRAAQTTSP